MVIIIRPVYNFFSCYLFKFTNVKCYRNNILVEGTYGMLSLNGSSLNLIRDEMF